MEITDVRVKVVDNRTDRLKAFATITFDDVFVVRDLKIVDGVTGLFVAMPSRKATIACRRCNHRNQIRSKHCNQCGGSLPPSQGHDDEEGRSRMHRDIAHPITPEFRELVQERVLEAFHETMKRHEAEAGDQPDQPSSQNGDESAVDDSEFDSLIAGLDRGSRRGRGGRTGKRDSRRREDKHSEPRPESRENGLRSKPAKSSTTKPPVEKTPAPIMPAPPEGDDNETFGVNIVAEPKPRKKAAAKVSPPVEEVTPAPDEVSLDAEASEQPMAENVNEGSAPFGAGIG